MTMSGLSHDRATPEPGRAGSAPDPGAPPIVIRPICAEDKQALRDGCERLSERSRYRRFLSAHGTLTPAELTYFTEVDHHDHEALVAIDPATGEGIGVARYIRCGVDPDVAELAVAVADDWQRHGVGNRLTEALAGRARSEGIKRFTALMLAENDLMLSLIKHLGVVHDMHLEHGIVEITVDVPGDGVGDVSRLLRATARGDIVALGHPGPRRSLGPRKGREPTAAASGPPMVSRSLH
jgi:GNAT superfamily N-acetyltransferase